MNLFFKRCNYCRNVIAVDWGLVVKLALSGKVTKGARRDLEFDSPHLINIFRDHWIW
jgi:hypothetical protein